MKSLSTVTCLCVVGCSFWLLFSDESASQAMPATIFDDSQSATVILKDESVTLQGISRRDSTDPLAIQLQLGDEKRVLRLPERVDQRTIVGTISQIRACAYVRRSIVALVQIGENDFASFWLLVIDDRDHGAKGIGRFQLGRCFRLMEGASSIRLGDVGNPEGDSLVATLYDAQPIPETERHALMIFRSDCPALDDTPFAVRYEYPTAAELAKLSREHEMAVRPLTRPKNQAN